MSFSDFKKALNPKTSKTFFSEMQPHDLITNLRYLLVVAIPTFLGTFLLYGIFGFNVSFGFGDIVPSVGIMYSVYDSLILALSNYVVWIIMPLAMGALLSQVSQQIAGRKISLNEGMTMMAYVFTPILIFNFLTAFSLIGIFASSLGGLYSAFLLYYATRSRFPKSWLKIFLSFVVTELIVLSLIGTVIGSLTPDMVPVEEFSLFSGGKSITFSSGGISLVNVGERDFEFKACAHETDQDDRDECYGWVAFDYDYPDACEKIVDLELKDECYSDVAFFTKNAALCALVRDNEMKQDCYGDI